MAYIVPMHVKPKFTYLLIRHSVGNSHRSASPRQTALEEDRELFVNFSLILCLWFEIQDLRAYNFFDWISNTDNIFIKRHMAVLPFLD